jgi:3D (Asp-Asp-Asp) domain-containing protein
VNPPFKKPVAVALSCILLTALAYVALIFMSRNTLTADGKTIRHYSFTKGTVQELLTQYSISLSTKDIVSPPLEQKIRWGQSIQVVRVIERFEKKTESVDFVLDWKSRSTRNLRKIEYQRGHRENKIWFVKQILHDGQVVSEEDSPKIVHKTPVQRVVLLNSRDYPEKIYDLSKVKKVTLIATAYWKGDPQVPGVITYSGHKVERGLVAVDPKVLPLGWRLFVAGIPGRSPDYGYAYSSDTGSKIKGNRIDLFVEGKKESRKWEYTKVQVYLLEKTKKW